MLNEIIYTLQNCNGVTHNTWVWVFSRRNNEEGTYKLEIPDLHAITIKLASGRIDNTLGVPVKCLDSFPSGMFNDLQKKQDRLLIRNYKYYQSVYH